MNIFISHNNNFITMTLEEIQNKLTMLLLQHHSLKSELNKMKDKDFDSVLALINYNSEYNYALTFDSDDIKFYKKTDVQTIFSSDVYDELNTLEKQGYKIEDVIEDIENIIAPRIVHDTQCIGCARSNDGTCYEKNDFFKSSIGCSRHSSGTRVDFTKIYMGLPSGMNICPIMSSYEATYGKSFSNNIITFKDDKNYECKFDVFNIPLYYTVVNDVLYIKVSQPRRNLYFIYIIESFDLKSLFKGFVPICLDDLSEYDSNVMDNIDRIKN